MSINVYGKLKSEQLAEEKEMCRKILSEINNVGITQHQRLFLIYILALELENMSARQDLSIVTKTFLEEMGSTFEQDNIKG